MRHVLARRLRSGDRLARPRLLLVAAVLGPLSALLLTTGVASAQETPPGGSWVRAAHLLPGAPQMQVTVTPVGAGAAIELSAGLPYGQATDYRAFPPASYAVALRPVGTPATDPPLLTTTYTAVAGAAVTLAALGTSDAPRLAVLQDDLTPPAAGQSRVRVLPAAGGAPQVTVQAVGGPTLATEAVFGQPTAYVSVPAGPWQLQARADGGGRGSGTVELASGGVYTVLIVDGPGGGLQTTTLQDAAGVALAPVGGVATGAGGTAPRPASVPPPVVLIAAGVLLAAGATRRTMVRRARP